MRLPKDIPVHVVGVNLNWNSEAAVEALLDELLSGAP